ncbi:SAVED domain-containing protein [Sphingobacterium sp. IITKGP-BTPF85]|uniref:SAVED domain-containing protein n=1 Tax=Sphingobacterium sp. IITKGP-BTPF85 TaxID=1338009 RepID=UPI000389EBBF|nr:SAVED domain-containing protein [Sphingobacterium sp. IITKGP-BTPF85]KKX51796.1 hypothetical protein L950_0203165 [Sphingobacterium sp. IITKGP-BTPF85]
MSTTSISPINKYLIWIRSAGRCQYIGCNKELHTDILTKRNFNQAYIAHIIADQPKGPRGDNILSPQLADDISNLMLMCDAHHRLIDKVDVLGHPESVLLDMKKEHEERIKNVTNIQPDRKSYIVSYNANIGSNTPNVSYPMVSSFLRPDYYPAKDSSIELGLVNSLDRDSDLSFWSTELRNLKMKFDRFLLPMIKSGEINHISLFAFAPIPLLIQLGVLINDMVAVDVRQKRRIPDTWAFGDDIETDFVYSENTRSLKTVALKLELSADITDDRVEKVLGDEVSIYSIRIQNPTNDFIESRRQIRDFGKKMREVLNVIKKNHSQDTTLHIFPAIPISLAVEVGRVWMPKADLALKIYDQNSKLGGFVETIFLKHE